MMAGFVAGWVATAALAGFIVMRFAITAPSASLPPPAPDATNLPAPATNPPPAVAPPANTRAAGSMVAGVAPAIPAGSANAATDAEDAQHKANLLAAKAEAAAAKAAADAASADPTPPVLTPGPMVSTPDAGLTVTAPGTSSARRPMSYAEMTAGPTEQGVRLNLRNVTIDQALQFLTDKAGFIIDRRTGTGVANIGAGTVDLQSSTPLSRDEIVAVFNKVLASKNLTAIQDGLTLTIMTIEDARGNAATQVKIDDGWTNIPSDAQLVTEVIPVHSLNPRQVVTDLATLIPPMAVMNTSDAGNAIVMTASQQDVRRFAQIIAALDSTGNGDLEVFLLTYADSKSIAQELKDIFTSDSGGGGGGGDTSARTGVHVNAVSDDQNNAVLVSAPMDFMPGISNVITKLDIPQEDSIVIQLFTLKNADCSDVTSELLALFPDPNTGANAGARGGRGNNMQLAGGRGGAAGGGGGSTSMSARQMKQVTVNAVADPRTQSVLVTASKDTMAQIEQIIDKMDSKDNGHVEVFVFRPVNGDVLDFAGPLSDLVTSANGRNSSSSTSTSGNALQQRITSGASSATTTASSSISTSSSSGGGGGGTGGGR
jgi:type II secretory pathway component GspD/PulD (secretin)